MSKAEMQSLALGQLANALSETTWAISALGSETISARMDLARVRVAWLRRDGTYETRDTFLAAQEEARAACDVLALRARTLREIKSSLQTLCKSSA